MFVFLKKKPAPPYDPQAFVKAEHLSMKSPLGQPYTDVSCTIPLGCAVAIRAGSGGGKTPFLLTMAGRMAPTEGIMTVAGYRIPKERAQVARIAGLGLFEGLNDLEENLMAVSLLRAEMDVYDKPTNRESISRYMAAYGISHLEKVRIRDYEKADLVALGVALGMAGDPKVLVVDDVEDQLTRDQSRRIIAGLRGLARKKNIVVAFACTDEELAREADMAVDLNEGKR